MIMPSNHLDLVAKAREVAASVGIDLPDCLPVGTWVRMPGQGKKPSNTAAGAKLENNCIHLIDHSTGWSETVFSDSQSNFGTLGEADLSALRKHNAAEREHLLKERLKKQAKAMQSLKHCLQSKCLPCSWTEYTKKKGIQTHGCLYNASEKYLAVLLHDIHGKLQSAQRIFDNGDKRCWWDLPTYGASHMFGELTTAQPVIIAEGFATAATLHEQTGKTVLAAMFSNNLLAVAIALRERYPDQQITICGDDDRGTIGNPGRAKATEAANAIDASLAFPVFPEGVAGSDFNDLHLAGLGVES